MMSKPDDQIAATRLRSFFAEMATAVADLCKADRAIFVTMATALEINSLGGLRWGSSCRPEDIAFGWLLASKAGHSACVTDTLDEREERYQRAAQCAELALIARDVCLNAADCPRLDEADFINPHLDSRDGALAAWRFICDELERQLQVATAAAAAKGYQGIVDWRVPILARYDFEKEMMEASK